MYIPLPLDALMLNTPVPINIWDRHGTLLLRKGEAIVSEQHRQNLMMHSPMVDAEDYKAWNYSYKTELDKLVRSNQPLTKLAGLTRPAELNEWQEREQFDPVAVWPDLHARLSTLLHQNTQAQDFMSRLIQVEQQAQQTLRSRVDDSLFVLVQLLMDRRVRYSATHALLCAVICRLVAPNIGIVEAEQASLFRAALTMNIGMARLHDELARQTMPPTEPQKQRIVAHPHDGVLCLRQLGVGDKLWLQLVQDHHEETSGQGYPAGKQDVGVATQLLHRVDVFVARISPRSTRAGLLPHYAARDAYLDRDGKPSPLGAALIKAVGVYIPGSYVRLANGEVAVVVRRGRRANEPMVFSLIGRHGMPLGEPALRDTGDRLYAVQGSVAADEVKVRVNATKLFQRV